MTLQLYLQMAYSRSVKLTKKDFLVTKNPPLVLSMSWGWPEPDQCQVGNCTNDETSLQYVQRTNVEFQKIGLMGVTLIAASGDQG